MTPESRWATVVGAGVKTPAGQSLSELWSTLLAGTAAMSLFRHPRLPEGTSVMVAEVGGFDPLRYVSGRDAARLDRVHLLALGAAEDALSTVTDRPPPQRCAVVCGVGYGASERIEETHRVAATTGLRGLSPFAIPMVMANSTAAQLAIRHRFEGPCLTVATACASGADAIGQGVELLRRGAADLVLAGGVDAMLTPTPVLGYYRTGALSRAVRPDQVRGPFDLDRSGFVLAEGAGFVVLRRRDDSGGDEPFGQVAGYAANCDAHHIVAPRADGAVAARCVQEALQDAGITPEQVGHINAHGTATRFNDLAESRAVTRIFDRPPPVTAVKGATGHMIGGSGAVEAVVSMLVLRHGLLPPTAGLHTVDPDIGLDVVSDRPRTVPDSYGISNSFGFGGHNTVLVLAAPGATAG